MNIVLFRFGALFCGYLFVFLYAVGLPLDFDPVVSAGAAFVLAAITEYRIEKNRTDKVKAAKSSLSYDNKSHTLTVHNRNYANSNVLKIEEVKSFSTVYHPSKMVYTGVTVGNVHTGGFHDAGNYHELKMSGTQKYQILYTGAGAEEYSPVDVLKFDDAILKHAKAFSLFKTLQQEGDTVTLSKKIMKEDHRYLETAGNPELAIKKAKEQVISSKLTKEECQQIKDWLCATTVVNEARSSKNTGHETISEQVSAADELKKLKELLDMGVITQEEFDAKKKQLLGL